MILRLIEKLSWWKTALRALKRIKRSSMIVAPPSNEGMTTLDRAAFKSSFPVLAVRVPWSRTADVLRAPVMRMSALNLPKVKTVVHDPADPNGDRLVLLRHMEEAEIPAETRDFLKPISTGLVTYQLDFDYDFWTVDEILRSVLPGELSERTPTGFATMGHIAHLNLRDEFLPYRYLIGQVILDKNKRLKTVVNKLNTIHNKFRVFEMELIAGEPNYIVDHHESNCRFTFDFSQVYFNARLHHEHERIVSCFKPTDVIADVFAGVGPFAVPAARKGCAVWANDLNPVSNEYLKKNVAQNYVTELVDVSCMDGREFIRWVIGRSMEEPFVEFTGPVISRNQWRKLKYRRRDGEAPHLTQDTLPPSLAQNKGASAGFRRRIDQFVMNLPDTAIEFLDAFRGAFREDEEAAAAVGRAWEVKAVYDRMPTVHCHCFTRELDAVNAKKDILMRVEEVLRYKFRDEDELQFHYVRTVAPSKHMWCISFRLPRDVGFARH